ncbi:hypothetical protein [Mycobacterium sp. DL99]|uniref:hypothetical protein n=1 Tax=Mycobacterium sp. DL99 TaxID=2528957 RepID=UPI0010807540|nr:hypothetical protein [Mycobacterium sp. DL99]
MLDTEKIVRALRDFSPAMLGLLVVLAALHGGALRAVSFGAVLALLVAGGIGYFMSRNLLPYRPARAVLWVEARTYGLVGGFYTLCYSGVMYFFWTVASKFESSSQKYFISASSGFVVALFTNALIKPGESDSWGAYWWKKLYIPSFKQFFHPLNRPGGAWSSDGPQSKALQAEDFYDDHGKISGWGFRARRVRSKFLEARIPDADRIGTSKVKVLDSVKVINKKNMHFKKVGEVHEIRTNEKFPVIVDFGDPDCWWGLRYEALWVVDPAEQIPAR